MRRRPTSPADVLTYGGTFDPALAHSQWVSGMLTHTGMTTTFPPNTPVIYMAGSTPVDIDLISSRLGISATLPTYGVITARSYHTGLVHVLLMDGSTRSVSNSINGTVWVRLAARKAKWSGSTNRRRKPDDRGPCRDSGLEGKNRDGGI